jgi:branched-chain amino acid transport system substrate-binding protein
MFVFSKMLGEESMESTGKNQEMATESARLQGVTRRQFVKTGAAVAAAGSILGKKAFASNRPLKIGYVSPKTGALASFGESDEYVINDFRRILQSGIPTMGGARQVEVVVRDSQSSPNRAGQVAAQMIKQDQVDIMLVAGTPETVNPVADQCELNNVPCISTDATWQGFFFGRGGRPGKGFDWTYHFFWGSETVSEVMCDLFSGIPNNKVVGCMWANDTEGNLFSDAQRGFPPTFARRGFKVIDPGRFHLDSTDFSAQISKFKSMNCEVLHGIMPAPAFATFMSQAKQQGFRPKVAVIGKALLFPAEVEALGPLGKNLSIELWWGPNYPFKSAITGKTPAQICAAYEATTKRQWTQALGFRYALFEIAMDTFKRAKDPNSAKAVVQALRETKLQTVVGPIQWQGAPPNKWTTIPMNNVCTTPLVGGQWVPGKKWKYDLEVVDNRRYPIIPVQRKMQPL